MRKLKYKTDGWTCLTLCKNQYIYIGTSNCATCRYFIKNEWKKQIVICSLKVKNKMNNKRIIKIAYILNNKLDVKISDLTFWLEYFCETSPSFKEMKKKIAVIKKDNELWAERAEDRNAYKKEIKDYFAGQRL